MQDLESIIILYSLLVKIEEL